MENMGNYLDILKEGLTKKKEVLTQILELNRKQEVVLQAEILDAEAFDQLVHEKSTYIDGLIHLDEGFEATYERIKEPLEAQKAVYATQIEEFQKRIREIMDLSVEIQASEARNKTKVDAYFDLERKKLGKSRVSQKAAMNYYKSASRVNYIDPQLMDKKK